MVVGLPGMILLQQFSPLGTRDPEVSEKAEKIVRPLGQGAILFRSVIGGITAFLCGIAATAILAAMKTLHLRPEGEFDIFLPLYAIFNPQTITEWSQLMGNILLGLIIGLATAATYAARSSDRILSSPSPK